MIYNLVLGFKYKFLKDVYTWHWYRKTKKKNVLYERSLLDIHIELGIYRFGIGAFIGINIPIKSKFSYSLIDKINYYNELWC